MAKKTLSMEMLNETTCKHERKVYAMLHRNQLSGMNIVVYDCEIKSCIDNKEVTWNDHHKMGISVACLFDYQIMDYVVFLDDNIADLAKRLNEADLIVAFNNIGFDNKLVRACGFPLKDDSELPQYDMLIESRKSIGWGWGKNFPKGCKLDDHLGATFGVKFMMKTANGEEAPRMYQRGEMGKLISYCLADVTRERALFEHVWEQRIVRTVTNGVHAMAHPSGFIRSGK